MKIMMTTTSVCVDDADWPDFLPIYDLFHSSADSASHFNVIIGDVIAINAARVLGKRLFKVKAAPE